MSSQVQALSRLLRRYGLGERSQRRIHSESEVSTIKMKLFYDFYIKDLFREEHLADIARGLFNEIGRTLKKRRQKDEQMSLASRLSLEQESTFGQILINLNSQDPAASDLDLDKKLSENKRIAEEKIDNVIFEIYAKNHLFRITLTNG